MARALVFPGQGSQYVGMGKALADALPVARAVFEEIDDALSQNLFRLMTQGPEDELRLTENTQPALMAASMAVIRVLEDSGYAVSRIASHVAGHSLGEYTAHCAAGTMALADTARLLKRRGQAMQRAVPVGEGAMAAILGLEFDDVTDVVEQAADGQVLAIANDNSPGQLVISGHVAAVDRAIELAKERGAKRGLKLPVSAPFHCPLMGPAAEEMAEALAQVTLQEPTVPIIANVTASPIQGPQRARELLVEQVTAMVRWRESVGEFAGLGIDSVVEIGAGKVLTGLVRRIDRTLSITNVETPDDIESFVAGL